MSREPSPLLLRGLAMLAALGIGWALMLIVLGGIDLTLGGLTITSNEPRRPFYAGALAAAMHVWLTGVDPWRLRLDRLRRRIPAGLSQVVGSWLRADRLAVLLTIVTLLVGLRWTSTTAAAADEYGYVSQADLWLKRDLRIEQPWVDEVPWNNAPWTFAELGYRPVGEAGDRAVVPTYSPGLPLLMAAAKLAGGQAAMFVVVPLLGAAMVWCTYRLGLRVTTPWFALLAAALVATSPPFLSQLVVPMSDVPAAAFWSLAALGVISAGTGTALVAGLAAGLATLVRPNLIYLSIVLGLWFVVDATRRRARGWLALQRGATFSIGAIGGAVVVAAFNRYLFGSAAESGYGRIDQIFSVSHLGPNLWRYLNWTWTATPVALVGLAALALPLRRLWQPPAARGFAALAAVFTAAVWMQYLAYLVFDHWSYLRFLLPTYPLVMIAAALVVRALLVVPHPTVRLVSVLAVGLIFVEQISFASREFVFSSARDERHYAGAAIALRNATPPEAVVLSRQFSGALQYYGGRTALRYDELDADALDEAVTWLVSRGVPVYAMLEDVERHQFELRFKGERLAAELPARLIVTYRGSSPITIYQLSGPPPAGEPTMVPPIPEHGPVPMPADDPRPALRLKPPR
ncbi:MAG TPA: glycosyltransferase family 39 protein [Vicinamibacterales bacterium]|nr:glycosyltransferase family 39 protein [Vicinamibacterales bacterium]